MGGHKREVYYIMLRSFFICQF